MRPNQAMLEGFTDEFEKLAVNPSSVAKLLGAFTKLKNFGAAASTASKNKKLLNYLARHGSGRFTKGPGGKVIYNKTRVPKAETGFLQKVTGNIAKNVQHMAQGYSRKNSFMQNMKQYAKNLGSLGAQQIRGGRYKIVSGNKVTKLPGGKLVYRNNFKLPFTKKRIKSPFYRKVNNTYGQNQFVVRKSAPFQAIGVASTPVGFGATTLALNPTPKGAKEGFKEFAEWTFAPPVATAKLIKSMTQGM